MGRRPEKSSFSSLSCLQWKESLVLDSKRQLEPHSNSSSRLEQAVTLQNFKPSCLQSFMFYKCLSPRTLQGPHPLPLKNWGLNTKEQLVVTFSNCSQITFSFDSCFMSIFVLLHGKCSLALNDCCYTNKLGWVMKCSSSLCSSPCNWKFEGSQSPARLNSR